MIKDSKKLAEYVAAKIDGLLDLIDPIIEHKTVVIFIGLSKRRKHGKIIRKVQSQKR